MTSNRVPWQAAGAGVVGSAMLYAVLGVVALVAAYFNGIIITIVLLVLLTLIMLFAVIIALNLTRGFSMYCMAFVLIHHILCALCFAIYFMNQGVLDTGTNVVDHSFASGLILSMNTWSTLGYSDLIPRSGYRFYASLESFIAIINIAISVSLIWKIIDESIDKPDDTAFDRSSVNRAKDHARQRAEAENERNGEDES